MCIRNLCSKEKLCQGSAVELYSTKQILKFCCLAVWKHLIIKKQERNKNTTLDYGHYSQQPAIATMLISLIHNHGSSCIHCMLTTFLWCLCVCVLSVCVRFFMCLASLASSSPCQQSVVFLLAGLTLRHVKRATGKKRQVNSRFP